MKINLSLLFLIVFSLCHVKSETIKCKFHMNSLWWESNGNYYECEILNKKTFTGQQLIGSNPEGHHLRGKSIDDVQSIYIDSAIKMHKFPKHINSIFKNLILIRIVSSKLGKISNEDLKNFPKLKFLYIRSNHIEHIQHDLLKHNPAIEVIDLVNNKIMHIDERAFSDLQNLRALDLRFNECENLGHSSTNFGVQEMIKKIEVGECQSEKYQDHKSLKKIFKNFFYKYLFEVKLF